MLETNHSAFMFIYETHALSSTGFVVFPVRSVSCLVFSPNSVWLFFPFLQFQPKVFSFSRYFLQFEIRDNRSLKWEIRRIPIGKILMMLLVTHTRLRLKFPSSQVECRYQREFIFIAFQTQKTFDLNFVIMLFRTIAGTWPFTYSNHLF